MILICALVLIAALIAAPSSPGLPTASASTQLRADERSALLRARPLLVVLVAVGCMAILGPKAGVVVGLIAAVLVWRTLDAAESPSQRRRRQALVADLPVAVDLIAACLDAGTSVMQALEAVAASLPGPVADELAVIVARLRLGAAPASMWRAVGASGPLAPLGRAMARSHESGASVVTAMALLSAELRDAAMEGIEARARTVEVRAAAPLGVCLLPAFMVLGVVPLTAGLFAGLDFLG